MKNLFKMWEQRLWVPVLVLWMGYILIFVHTAHADVVLEIIAAIITTAVTWFAGALLLRMFRWAITNK